ncbi:FAD-dependent oxidoreductase [Halostella litorea]|uniref:FAD-dependent oxidoreductase n=1 Tax=Halostella litorea TaxID=2528831 RepID=UPI0010926F54|nr:FAD-dependent oxidoreductase [Halostella litorea]
MSSTDVLVVGGGATGVGIARDLAMRGVDATLVERNGLNGGTTGRSHGLLHSGARYAENDPEGARECIRENRVLREIAPHCLGGDGGYFVSLADDDPDYFDEKVAACRDLDIPVDVLGADAAREAVPDLAADAERVAAVPDRVIHPSALVAATAADAREHGATIRPHAPVTDLLVEGGAVAGATVETGAGTETVRADHVVNATGAWAGELAAMAGVEVAMRPARGVMVAVDYPGLPVVLNRCRPPADGDIVVPHDGQAVLGTTSVDVADPDDYPREDWEVERCVEECARLLPPVADAAVERTWWGVRPLYGPDEDERPGGRGISRGFFVLDHADRDGVPGFTTVVGGKLTTHREMAEAVADRVCGRLGVDAACRTADEPLPFRDDPAELAAAVDEFDAAAPSDADVVGR